MQHTTIDTFAYENFKRGEEKKINTRCDDEKQRNDGNINLAEQHFKINSFHTFFNQNYQILVLVILCNR